MRVLGLLLLLPVAQGFGVVPTRSSRVQPVQMGLMDGFKKAFENEQYSTKESAGLTGGAKQPIEVTIVGKTVKAIPGQRMKDVIRSARANIPFNCENGSLFLVNLVTFSAGECGTCECLVNGRKIRVCKFNVPQKGPVVIKLK